jgi:hypothetical protein
VSDHFTAERNSTRPRVIRRMFQSRVWECDTEDGQFHLHWWLADAGPGDLQLQATEVSEARWIRPIDFRGLAPTFADDRRFFEEVLPALPQTTSTAEERYPLQ